ncbi:MAG: hypothetical protein ABH950_04665 [Candidatus Altiarchaeota archaeon]
MDKLCVLCNNKIMGYSIEFNRLEIDENKDVDICPECISKFSKWQQKTLSKLFPTKAAKKRFGKG